MGFVAYRFPFEPAFHLPWTYWSCSEFHGSVRHKARILEELAFRVRPHRELTCLRGTDLLGRSFYCTFFYNQSNPHQQYDSPVHRMPNSCAPRHLLGVQQIFIQTRRALYVRAQICCASSCHQEGNAHAVQPPFPCVWLSIFFVCIVKWMVHIANA